MSKLNLGAGNIIKEGYINHDIVELEGIDCVHDLNIFPWPWEDNSFDLILAFDVIEHLDDFMNVMNEIHRVLKKDGHCLLQVPYWNSWGAIADPTHKKNFNEFTFQFLDPNSKFNQERHYYSNTRFEILEEYFSYAFFSPYLTIPFLGKRYTKAKLSKIILGIFANIFNNIILDIKIKLRKIS